ncbi:DinB family protein [Rhodohalobacter sp. 614A]|uniref:DinB family protein n=1 Tax=Rhodohalobacter sp. 614A TaxID=2908649 RepID=UPI001F182491|nr:DinB family protein [Rhodohalobacter sp. 614A]
MADAYSYLQLTDLFNKDLSRIDEFHAIPDDLISLKPDPTTWSASEVIQHVIKFNELYISQMDVAVDSNNMVKAQKELFKPRFVFRHAIRFFEPPYKVKVKTFAPMYPNNSGNKDPKQPIDELAEMNRNLIRRIETFRDEQLDLDRIKGKNPIIKWIPMSLSEFILLLEAHQRRHFWQIEQTLLKLSGQKY